MIGEPTVPLLPPPPPLAKPMVSLSILYNFHLTFLEELLYDIAQSRHRKSLESTLIYLTLHLQL